MRKTKLFFCAAAFAVGLTASAQVAYDATAGTVPTAQGWNELKLDNTVSNQAATVSQVVDGGKLKVAAEDGKFGQLGWWRAGVGLDPAKGYSIEIKAKVAKAAKTAAFNIQGFDTEGTGFRLGISPTGITEQTNQLAATNVLATGLVNDDAFHIYNLEVVPASGTVTVKRDGSIVGTFPVKAFMFDNIVENGGFENGDEHDFTSNSILARTNAAGEVKTGDYGFIINSDGKNNQTNPKELATTRAYPVKPNAKYEFSLNARNLITNNDWAWRDWAGYYNTQNGTLTGNNDPNVFWWNNPFESIYWRKHRHEFTTPSDVASVRFETPSWIREGSKNTSKIGFDNVYFRELNDASAMRVGPTTVAKGFDAPIIPAGITNLIYNGDFEDEHLNNDGTVYDWAISRSDDGADNNPVANNSIWNNDVRLQAYGQGNDGLSNETGIVNNWAHSGSHSLRFFTFFDANKDIDFHVELEANKTYRFVFWHKSPAHNDWGWLFVRNGNEVPFWGHNTGNHLNKWVPVDLTFTTTEDDHTLHLYTEGTKRNGPVVFYFDDFTLYEVTGGVLDPQIAGKTNLIANGDFEDGTLNNDGVPYIWALASSLTTANDNNLPLEENALWGTAVHLQDKEKRGGNVAYTDWNVSDDTGLQWAHSGTKAFRFSTHGINLNLDFKKELEPNKTYTFVFWYKTARYDDDGGGGKFHVANGTYDVMALPATNKYCNWTRQSVTFSTTASNHTLRIYTDYSNWFNLYLDDLFLYEEDTYVPYTPTGGNSYLFFGKSTGTSETDVEIEYVTVNNNGGGILEDEMYLIGGPVNKQNGGWTLNDRVKLEKDVSNPYLFHYKGYLFRNWRGDEPGNLKFVLGNTWENGYHPAGGYVTLSGETPLCKGDCGDTKWWLHENRSQDGYYELTLDLQNYVLRVDSFRADNGPAEVYLVGDATPAGWNNDAAHLANTKMTRISLESPVYQWQGALTGGEGVEGFKFHHPLGIGNWDFGYVSTTANQLITYETDYNVKFEVRNSTTSFDDFKFKMPEPAEVLVTLDLNNNTVKIEKVISYVTVTFNSNGGSAVEAQYFVENETAAEPAAPKKAGYTFSGWCSDTELANAYNFATPVSGDITLYAKWTADENYRETYYIDFGQDATNWGDKTVGVDVNGNVWNNVVAPSGAPSSLAAGYTLSLVNSKDESTGAGFELIKKISSNGKANCLLPNPNPALLGDLAIGTATNDYFFLDDGIGNQGYFRFNGLNAAKAYKFYIFGARATNDVRGGTFYIHGQNQFNDYLQTSGSGIGTEVTNINDNTILVSAPVIPKADGTIDFEFFIASNASKFVYINALKIVEVDAPAELTVARKFYIDFGRNDGSQGLLTEGADANGNYWNNVYSNGSEMRPGICPNALVTSTNETTAYTVALNALVGDNPQFNGLQNGGLGTPDAALLGDLAIATATRDYIFTNGAPIVFTFGNLNTTRSYRFSIFGSRSDDNGRLGSIAIAGENTWTGTHQMGGKHIGGTGVNANNRIITVSDTIVPTSEGQITLTLTAKFNMAHINIIKIEEFVQSETNTSNVSAGNLNVLSINHSLVVEPSVASMVSIYNVAGLLVAREYVSDSKTFSLPTGVYIVKANAEVVKAINN